jgi:hypothetical protein
MVALGSAADGGGVGRRLGKEGDPWVRVLEVQHDAG